MPVTQGNPTQKPSTGRTIANTAAASATTTLWPHASRAAIVLFGGGALIAFRLITDPGTGPAMVTLGQALLGHASLSSVQKAPGAAGAALKAELGAGVFVLALAFFAGLSEGTGTIALLILAGMWLVYLISGNSPLHRSSSSTSASSTNKPA